MMKILMVVLIIFSEEDKVHKRKMISGAMVAVGVAKKFERNISFIKNWMEWESHVLMLMVKSPNSFQRYYRMSYSSFMNLLNLLDPTLAVDTCCTLSPMTPDVQLHCL